MCYFYATGRDLYTVHHVYCHLTRYTCAVLSAVIFVWLWEGVVCSGREFVELRKFRYYYDVYLMHTY